MSTEDQKGHSILWNAKTEMREKRILFIDDDREMRHLVSDFFLSEGYSASVAESGDKALKQISEFDFDVVVTDLRMPEMDGMALLKEIRAKDPSLPVILITAFGSIETAVDAMKEGAANFVPKPFKMQTLKAVIDKAIEQKWLFEENRFLKEELEEKYSFHNIIGKSKAMQDLYSMIQRVAGSNTNVLHVRSC